MSAAVAVPRLISGRQVALRFVPDLVGHLVERLDHRNQRLGMPVWPGSEDVWLVNFPLLGERSNPCLLDKEMLCALPIPAEQGQAALFDCDRQVAEAQ